MAWHWKPAIALDIVEKIEYIRFHHAISLRKTFFKAKTAKCCLTWHIGLADAVGHMRNSVTRSGSRYQTLVAFFERFLIRFWFEIPEIPFVSSFDVWFQVAKSLGSRLAWAFHSEHGKITALDFKIERKITNQSLGGLRTENHGVQSPQTFLVKTFFFLQSPGQHEDRSTFK